MKPSPNGNGRDPDTGRFLPGNAGGPGNPLASKQEKFRAILMRCVTEQDFEQVCTKLVKTALTGDGPDWRFAVQEINDRLMGKSTQPVDIGGKMGESAAEYFRAIAQRFDASR